MIGDDLTRHGFAARVFLFFSLPLSIIYGKFKIPPVPEGGEKILPSIYEDIFNIKNNLIVAAFDSRNRIVFDTLGNLIWKDTVIAVTQDKECSLYSVRTKTGYGVRQFDDKWVASPFASFSILKNNFNPNF